MALSRTAGERRGLSWFSPRALAEGVDEGFLTMARTAARVVERGVHHTVQASAGVLRARHGAQSRTNEPESSLPSSGDDPLSGEGHPSREAPVSPTGTEPAAAGAQETPQPDRAASAALNRLLAEHLIPDPVARVRVTSAIEDLLSGSAFVRGRAERELQEIGASAVPLLRSLLQGAPAGVTESLLRCLARCGADDHVAQTSELVGHADPEMRQVAVRLARSLPEPDRRSVILAALRDEHPEVRRRALGHLTSKRSPWARAEVIRLCGDPDQSVHWAALEALVGLDPDAVAARLEALLPRLGPIEERRANALLQQARRALGPEAGERSEPPPVGLPSEQAESP